MRMQSRHYSLQPYRVLLATSDGQELMIMKVGNSVFRVFFFYCMLGNYPLGIQSAKNLSSIFLLMSLGKFLTHMPLWLALAAFSHLVPEINF